MSSKRHLVELRDTESVRAYEEAGWRVLEVKMNPKTAEIVIYVLEWQRGGDPVKPEQKSK